METVPVCILCKAAGQSIVRVRGYCELCYGKQFIEPLKKEQKNLEEAISVVHNNLYERLNELGAARKVLAPKPSAKTYLCRKCLDERFDMMIKLIWHEENCDGTAYKTKKPPKPRQSQVRDKIEKDLAEEIFG